MFIYFCVFKFILSIFNSRMRSERFPFISGGLGVGRCSQTVAVVFAAVPGIALFPYRWVALTKCGKMICWMSVFSQIIFFCVW